jgi:membrane protein YdbS with pleckstrin-like domain
VQIVHLSSTLFQRRLGLADLRLVTAGHGTSGIVIVPDLDRDRAEALAAQLARRAAATPVAITL